MENSVDFDQIASSGSTLFSEEDVSRFSRKMVN